MSIVYAETSQNWSTELECDEGTTLRTLLAIASQCKTFEDVDIAEADGFAIWGRRVSPHYVLQENDRVEVLRRLKIEPMELRRINAQKTRKN